MRRRRDHQGTRSQSSGIDDQFVDLSVADVSTTACADDGSFVSSEKHNGFASSEEKQVFEKHLEQLQEQLVSIMIENKNLAEQMKLYKEKDNNEQLREELIKERTKRQKLEEQLNQSPRRRRSRIEELGRGSSGQSSRGFPVVTELGEQPAPVEVLPAEDQDRGHRSRLDVVWERSVSALYNMFDDFSEITKPETTSSDEEEPLSVKTLKENIKRFKLAVKPYIQTLSGINNVLTWKSPSYTFLVFLIYLYSVWHGFFIPLIFFLISIRLVVSFLHSKDFKFKFSYFDAAEENPETEDTLGLSDKFNLVLQVATKVQNLLGSAADGLEKLKNLFCWRCHAATKRVFMMSCLFCLMSAIMPTAYLWKLAGIGLGIKIFIINFIFNKYPRVKRRYDGTHKMWQNLPTDVEYEREYVQAEMDRYIVIPRDNEREKSISNEDTDSDSSSDGDSSHDFQEFRQLFSLPASECPLTGWTKGKRTVLVGKNRSVINLLAHKRGKLYLTKSFLCFEREKTPSRKNIVIPLQDVSNVDKVKINQRMPGRGMAIQIIIRSEGKQNVLLFGGIIGRDDVRKNILEAVYGLRRDRLDNPSPSRSSSISSRSSMDSVSSRISNFTFGALYEDSDD